MSVRKDVARKLATADAAREHYGVVVAGNNNELDQRATQDLRDSLKRGRKTLPVFDFGDRPNGNGARLTG
jgi:hypothetical protein